MWNVVSAPPPQAERAPPGRVRVDFFKEIVEIWTVGVVDLVVSACVLRATTKKLKKIVNFFFGGGKKSAPPNKILATPVGRSRLLIM